MAIELTIDELLENASHDVAAAQRGGGKRDYAYQQGVMTGLLRAKSNLGGSDEVTDQREQELSEAPIG